MKQEFEQLRDRAFLEIKAIMSSDALELFRSRYLGRRGELAGLMKRLKDSSPEERPLLGEIANGIKQQLEELYEQTLQLLGGTADAPLQPAVDASLPGISLSKGHMHPLTQMLHEWEDVFRDFGFSVADGPELESEYYNFEALNIPRHHPARDMWDTIYIKNPKSKTQNPKSQENRLLLRTHTSPVQIRAMEKYGAPLRIIIPGRVFRYEATDARHEHTFDQIEGLMIDRNISLSHLIAIMSEVVKRLVGDDLIQLRARPGFFPFTEPSIEFDLTCILCKQKGCPVCKHTGWLEFGGAGLVHPRVIEYGGLDPSVWTGFAFGMGPARLAMLKYGIDDIRLFNSGDLRFLEQF